MYSGILPGIFSGIHAGIQHLFWHSVWLKFWHAFWHSIWHLFWHSFGHSLWHSISVICCDIPAEIPSGILSGIVPGILFGMCSGPGAGDMEFGPRRGPFGSRRGSKHPELTTWLGKTRRTSGGAGVGTIGGENQGGEEGWGEGVAPLFLKARDYRDLHLAGGEKSCRFWDYPPGSANMIWRAWVIWAIPSDNSGWHILTWEPSSLNQNNSTSANSRGGGFCNTDFRFSTTWGGKTDSTKGQPWS